MPELPDVELFRQYIDSTSLHRGIAGVEVRSTKVLEGVSRGELARKLTGKRFERTYRRGKYLFVETDRPPHLMLHFGMSGALLLMEKEHRDGKYDRVVFSFDDGAALAYENRRQLGKVGLIDSVEKAIEEYRLGPDACEVSYEQFAETVSSGTGMIKPLLMDQTKIAGIGNIYSDEILFQAGVHPKTHCKQLDKKDVKTLYRSMQRVLSVAIKRHADPGKLPRSYLLPHRGPDQSCPRCGGAVKKISAGGRSGYYCPRCQKLPATQ
jgi:formamidopyrimidine-DNA glycosylase